MVVESSKIIMDTYNKLLNDERAYNVCISKKVIAGELVPIYISFCFWYELNLISCKLYLNKDNKTFKLISGTTEVFRKIKYDDLFEKLNKGKFNIGDSKAMFNTSRYFDSNISGIYILSKK